MSTEKLVSGSALSVAGASVEFNLMDTSGGGVAYALQKAVALSHQRVAAEASPSPSASNTCYNGAEFSETVSGGTIDFTVEFFYDSACTEPYMLRTLVISPPPSGGGTGTASGTAEVFDESGAAVDYDTLALTFVVDASGRLTQISEQKTAAPAPSATPYAQFGYACVYGTSSSIDCGSGNAINDSAAGESLGFVETTTVVSSPAPTASPSPAGTAAPMAFSGFAPRSFELSINGQGFTGALGALTLAPATPPAWTIAGGTQVATLTGTANLGFGFGSFVSSLSLTLIDSAAGLTTTLTSSGNHLSGTVTNSSGQTVATISLDRSGSGTISYSNGTTAPVKDWIILG
ncbi:MAG: hypothetical protein ACLPYS_13215 [Vulcanimicrobiaceae bacterium]